MDKNAKSATTNKTAHATKVEQTSTVTKTAVACRRDNTRIVQNVLYIWLDDTIDDKSMTCSDKIKQVQHVITKVDTFNDVDQCVDYLTDLTNEKVCVIISCETSSRILPLIHDISELYTIFIFCENETEHQHWPKACFKVQGIFTEMSSMCQALQQTAQQCEHNSILISFVSTTDDLSEKKLDRLEPSFMYTQIIKEILLSIDFEEKHFHQFIDYCRKILADNTSQLQNLDKLKETYQQKTSIWWYTSECFLYTMLNRALRTLDTDLIITLGFFVKDLHLQIEQLHNEQFSGPCSRQSFTLYRGQCITKEDFDKMTKTKGGLLSFNCFLSTSKNRNVSSFFHGSAMTNSNLIDILFVMTINPSESTTPFAAIGEVSCFENQEEEILFSMHSIFRINNITAIDKNQQLFQVDLALTNDNDPDLCILTDRIREDTYPNSRGWYELGQVLLQVGHSKKAKEVYEILLTQATTEKQKALIYNQIGCAKLNQGECKAAIIYFEKALAIQEQSLPSNHPELAVSYNNIGNVYYNMGEYSKALLSYEKALAIRQQSFPSNHPELAASYYNIGNVYVNMGEYSKALPSYEKALVIQQQSLPSNHPDLAASYNNIGAVYYNMGEYSKALSSHEKALAIRQQSLPSNHPDLASSYNNIGNVYSDMGEYSKALSSHEKALAIRQQSLPSNHPDLAKSYNNIGNVYSDMDEYSKALLSYEKALAIQQQSLPSNHPDLASSYYNIGNVYSDMDEYSKALSSHEKALAIRQQSLPSNHPDLASSYNNIGNVYDNMGEYSKALLSYEKALAIRQQSLPSNHPDLATFCNIIGAAYCRMGEYPKARSFFERAVQVAQQSLPRNHPH